MANGRSATNSDPDGRPGRLRRQLVEKEILDQAAQLFAERGFAGTRLKDLADALGISRPALYYYFSSKDAVLEGLVENLSGHDARTLRALRRKRNATPAEKLREMANVLATNAASNPLQARILSQNRHQLPEGLHEAVLDAERSIVRDLVEVIDEGMDSGVFRLVDPHTAALGVVGTCIWAAWWVDPALPAEAIEPIASQLADQAMSGLLNADQRGDRTSAPTVLNMIKDNVAQLERLIDGGA